jgi:hypothetical protein
MKLVKIINWVACLLFLASLFQPMEQHTLSGPCSWPCLYPFTYTVLDNSFTFVLSPVFLFFQLLFWNGFKLFFIAVVYSLIGTGEFLLLITPLLETKINSEFRQKTHLFLAFLSAVAILCYGLISDFRIGVDPLKIGYYYLTLAFLLAVLSSIFRYNTMRSQRPSKLPA